MNQPGGDRGYRDDDSDLLPMAVLSATGISRAPIPALPVDATGLAETLREHEALLQAANVRVAELTATLEAERIIATRREQAQLAELADLREQIEARDEELDVARAHLEAQKSLLDAAGGPLVSLRQQLAAARALIGELHTELDSVRGQLEASVASAAEARGRDAALDETGSAIEAAPAEVPMRVLVRTEEGTEFVYPLARYTTIGRAPDNDIQVNTSSVSRRHAMLISSHEHCIIEDLASTNGIRVNGERVTRHALRDGDLLSVGNTHFRYQQRT